MNLWTKRSENAALRQFESGHEAHCLMAACWMPACLMTAFPMIGALALFLGALVSPPAASSERPPIQALLEKTDDLTRGRSSAATMTMRVKTSRWEREMTMEVQSEGTEKTLVVITAPAKERGTATLKVENDIWNYLPKVDRTIKVPASMMAAGWMGSHFTNDDLVQQSRFSEDFTCEYVDDHPEIATHWLIACVPNADATVVYGKVLLRVRVGDELVDEVGYYDERERLVRTFEYLDIGPLGGRVVPRRVRVVPTDEPDEFTEMIYERLEFDIELPPSSFSLQALRN